jgi:hypothetical protein
MGQDGVMLEMPASTKNDGIYVGTHRSLINITN